MPICEFCQQEAPPKFLEELGKFGIDIYWCNTCFAEYVFWRDGALASKSLYTFINDKLYRWTFGFSSKESPSAILRWYKDPGEPGVRPNRNPVIVKSFNGTVPEITPDNIRDKIRFILLFL